VIETTQRIYSFTEGGNKASNEDNRIKKEEKGIMRHDIQKNKGNSEAE
jgi:hypothetical protein